MLLIVQKSDILERQVGMIVKEFQQSGKIETVSTMLRIKVKWFSI